MAQWLLMVAPAYSTDREAGPANVTGLPQWSGPDPSVCGGGGGGGGSVCVMDGNHCFGPSGLLSDFKSIPACMWCGITAGSEPASGRPCSCP